MTDLQSRQPGAQRAKEPAVDAVGGGESASRATRLSLRHRLPWQYFIVPLGLVAAWQAVVSAGVVSESLLPSPVSSVDAWWTWAFGSDAAVTGPYDGTWAPNVIASTWRVTVGFAIASLSGIVIGLMIGWYELPRKLLQPVVDLLRPIPVTAWVPFTVVFFGIRPMASISLIVVGTFFPVAVNAAAGAQATPPVLVRAARMLGTPSNRLISRVVLRAALPSILTGMRVGLSIAWVLVIVSEMVAVKSGLGFSLWDAYYFGRVDVIVAAMFSVGLLGYMSDQLLVWLSNRLMPWSTRIR